MFHKILTQNIDFPRFTKIIFILKNLEYIFFVEINIKRIHESRWKNSQSQSKYNLVFCGKEKGNFIIDICRERPRHSL